MTGHEHVHPATEEAFGARTDVGYTREHNEDALLVMPPLYAVCDGMGGHEAGEVASEIAARELRAHAPSTPDADALGHAVDEANLAIIHAVSEGIGREGMGTTCTAAMLDGDHLAIAQCGDSRAYLLHGGALQQLTRDHSLVADLIEKGEIQPEEARTHPWRSYITRALGLDPRIHADLYELSVEAGDRLMLCSDGLYSMVDDAKICRIMADEDDPQAAADKLTEAALDAGGNDNVTVIVVDAIGSKKRRRKMARKTRFAAITTVIALVLLLGGTGFALNWWMTKSAYLGEVDGKVAVYQGIPGQVLGMGHSELDEVTDVPMDALQPGTAARVRDHEIRCESIEAARHLVNEYRLDAGLDDATTPEGAASEDPSTAGAGAEGAPDGSGTAEAGADAAAAGTTSGGDATVDTADAPASEAGAR